MSKCKSNECIKSGIFGSNLNKDVYCDEHKLDGMF